MKIIFLIIFAYLTIRPQIAKAEEISVGTLNLWHYTTDYDKRLNNLFHKKSQLPQFLGVQEAWNYRLKANFYRQLKKAGGYSGKIKLTNRWGVMEEGLAVLGPHKPKIFKSYELPYSKKTAKRYATYGEFSWKNKSFGIINIHLTPGWDFTYKRLSQVKYIAEKIIPKLPKIPLIILGDFNTENIGTVLLPLIRLGFRSARPWDECTYCGANPYNTKNEYSKYDLILFKEADFSLKASSLIYDKSPISDHYGVKANLKFK